MKFTNKKMAITWPYQQFKLFCLAFFRILYKLRVCLTSIFLLSSRSSKCKPRSRYRHRKQERTKPVPILNIRQRYANTPFMPWPPERESDLPQSNKKTLFIDLDHTLVYASEDPPPDDQYSSEEQIIVDNEYYVVRRPGVGHLFRSAVESGFEIVIFTAAQESYASQVLDWLDPTSEFISHRLYRDDCTFDWKFHFYKDLDVTARPLDRSVVIDDSPWVYWKHYDNVIPVSRFTGNKNDWQLMRLLTFFKLERELDFLDIRCAVYCFVRSS